MQVLTSYWQRRVSCINRVCWLYLQHLVPLLIWILTSCPFYIIWEVLLATARWYLTSWGTYIFIMHAYIFRYLYVVIVSTLLRSLLNLVCHNLFRCDVCASFGANTVCFTFSLLQFFPTSLWACCFGFYVIWSNQGTPHSVVKLAWHTTARGSIPGWKGVKTELSQEDFHCR